MRVAWREFRECTLGSGASGTTTCPSSSAAGSALRSGHLSITWVYPEPKITVLAQRTTVGRDESCDAVLIGKEVSRRHAEFRRDGPVLSVRDLQSRNGLFVNGTKCELSLLRVGDVLRCGEWVAVVTDDAEYVPFHEISPGWHGSAKLQEAVEPTRRVGSALPIIVQGETGTGKEGLARTIHLQSGRKGPFVAVNCATLPVHLAESELFGHRRGAFTGAEKASTGLFRAAQQGTLLLDEIQELPAAIQPKLLRVLEQREVLPVGETTPIAIDVRIVVATQEALPVAVAAGRFRADLHARLDGLTVVLPPLRARREDIAPLFIAFLRQENGGRVPTLDPKLVEALCIYDWPLNVRELSLLSKRLLSLYSTETSLKREFLPPRILERAKSTAESIEAAPVSDRKRAWRPTKDEVEFDALVGALRAHNGNILRASESLGISRSRAYRLLSARPEFDIDDVRGGA